MAGLRQNFISVVSVRLLTVLSTFSFTSLLSFWLNKDAYGQIAALISLTLFASAIGEIGQRDVMAREVSRLQARHAFEAARVSGSVSTLIAIMGGILSGLLVAGAMLFSGASATVAALALALTLMLCVNSAWSGIGRGHGQFFWTLAPREVLWRLLALTAIGVAWTIERSVALDLTTWILVWALVAALTIQFIAVGKGRFVFEFSKVQNEIIDTWRKRLISGFDVMLIGVADLVLVTVDVIVIDMVVGSEATAEYYPANRLALLAFYLHIVFQLILAPRFARMFELGESNKIEEQSVRYARLSFAATLLSMILLIVCAPFYHYLFDTATEMTRDSVVILSVGYLAYSAGGFGSVLLVAAGHERKMRMITIVTSGLGLTLMLAGSHLGGPLAVACAVTVTTGVRVIAVAVVCRRSLGFGGSILG